MTEPSIKGTAFDSVLQDVRALIEDGTLDRTSLESRLESADLSFLDEKVQPSQWYPIASYARWLELLCETESPKQPEAYLFQRGVTAAERLHAAGIYPQLDASGKTLGLRVMPLVISLAGAIYNFTTWRTEVDEAGRRFEIRVEGARDFPDEARYAAEGFIRRTVERVTGATAVEVFSERADADHLVYRGAIEA